MGTWDFFIYLLLLNFQFSFHLETNLSEAGLICCDAYNFFFPSLVKESLICCPY